MAPARRVGQCGLAARLVERLTVGAPLHLVSGDRRAAVVVRHLPFDDGRPVGPLGSDEPGGVRGPHRRAFDLGPVALPDRVHRSHLHAVPRPVGEAIDHMAETGHLNRRPAAIVLNPVRGDRRAAGVVRRLPAHRELLVAGHNVNRPRARRAPGWAHPASQTHPTARSRSRRRPRATRTVYAAPLVSPSIR